MKAKILVPAILSILIINPPQSAAVERRCARPIPVNNILPSETAFKTKLYRIDRGDRVCLTKNGTSLIFQKALKPRSAASSSPVRALFRKHSTNPVQRKNIIASVGKSPIKADGQEISLTAYEEGAKNPLEVVVIDPAHDKVCAQVLVCGVTKHGKKRIYSTPCELKGAGAIEIPMDQCNLDLPTPIPTPSVTPDSDGSKCRPTRTIDGLNHPWWAVPLVSDVGAGEVLCPHAGAIAYTLVSYQEQQNGAVWEAKFRVTGRDGYYSDPLTFPPDIRNTFHGGQLFVISNNNPDAIIGYQLLKREAAKDADGRVQFSLAVGPEYSQLERVEWVDEEICTQQQVCGEIYGQDIQPRFKLYGSRCELRDANAMLVPAMLCETWDF